MISRPGISLITYPIRGSFAGIVAVESQNYHQSFKVVGDGVADGPMIPFIESTFSNKNLMKNSIMLLSRNDDFIFFPGDSVRFTCNRSKGELLLSILQAGFAAGASLFVPDPITN